MELTPHSLVDYVKYGLLADSKHGGELIHACGSRGVERSNCRHGFNREFRVSVTFARCYRHWVETSAMRSAGRGSSFSGHVSHVLNVRSDTQVIGPHAFRVVTGMHHQFPGWDLSVRQFPRHTMSRFVPAVSTRTNPNSAIVSSALGSSPHPALTAGIYVSPEPLAKWRYLGGHLSIVSPKDKTWQTTSN